MRTRLAPRVNQSGKPNPTSGKMCKVGPPSQRNPEFSAFYGRLVAAGKPKCAAIGACAAKLVRLMVAVLERGSAFEVRVAAN